MWSHNLGPFIILISGSSEEWAAGNTIFTLLLIFHIIILWLLWSSMVRAGVRTTDQVEPWGSTSQPWKPSFTHASPLIQNLWSTLERCSDTIFPHPFTCLFLETLTLVLPALFCVHSLWAFDLLLPSSYLLSWCWLPSSFGLHSSSPFSYFLFAPS